MNHLKAPLIAACASSFGLLFFNQAAFATPEPISTESEPTLKTNLSQRPELNPQDFYQKTWELVKDNYYDSKFNGQQWDIWKHKFDGKLNSKEDAYVGIETMLASLADSQARLLRKEELSAQLKAVIASDVGVGIVPYENKKRKVIVANVSPGPTACLADVHPGDEIVEIDGEQVKALKLEQVKGKLCGEKGTKVCLALKRQKQTFTVEIMRDAFQAPAVLVAERISKKAGYIRLASLMSQHAVEEMAQAVKNLVLCDVLILDLRDDAGGILSNSIQISNMFLDRGVICSSIDHDGYRQSQLAYRAGTKFEGKIILLINNGTAEMAELVVGALRDNSRAEVVGEKSFGAKATIAVVKSLGDGSGISIPKLQLLTPNGTDISNRGIEPDVRVQLSAAARKHGAGPWWTVDNAFDAKKLKDLQLRRAIKLLSYEVSTTHATKM